MKLWKFGLVGVVVLAIAGTAAGLVAAQTGSSTPDATSTQDAPDATSTKDGATSTPKSNSSNATPTTKDQLRDQFLNSLAANLGVSRDQLNTALTKTLNSMIDKAVADGKITQSEADKIKSKIAAGDFPLPGGFGRGFHQGFEKGFAMGANLQDIATFLNVDMSVIRDGLTNDQSLAQIAQAHGRSRDDLKSFLISNVTDKLNTAVKNQDITQKRADQALQNFKDNVDDLIDHQGAPFHGGGFFRGGMKGHDGADDDNDNNTPSTPGTNSTTTTSLTL